MVRFPGLRLGAYESDELTLTKLLRIASSVSGRPTPPSSDVAIKLASKFRVRFAVIFTPWIRGRGGNSFPESLPKKKSVFIGPNQRNIQGSSKASIGLARNMYMGSALSLNSSAPPTPRPHQRLCLPKDKFQPSKLPEI